MRIPPSAAEQQLIMLLWHPIINSIIITALSTPWASASGELYHPADELNVTQVFRHAHAGRGGLGGPFLSLHPQDSCDASRECLVGEAGFSEDEVRAAGFARAKREFVPYKTGKKVAAVVSSALDKLLLFSGYDKRIRPQVGCVHKKVRIWFPSGGLTYTGFTFMRQRKAKIGAKFFSRFVIDRRAVKERERNLFATFGFWGLFPFWLAFFPSPSEMVQ